MKASTFNGARRAARALRARRQRKNALGTLRAEVGPLRARVQALEAFVLKIATPNEGAISHGEAALKLLVLVQEARALLAAKEPS